MEEGIPLIEKYVELRIFVSVLFNFTRFFLPIAGQIKVQNRDRSQSAQSRCERAFVWGTKDELPAGRRERERERERISEREFLPFLHQLPSLPGSPRERKGFKSD